MFKKSQKEINKHDRYNSDPMKILYPKRGVGVTLEKSAPVGNVRSSGLKKEHPSQLST